MSRLSYMMKRAMKMDYSAMIKTANMLHKKCGKSRIWLLCDMVKCAAKYNAGYIDYKIAQMYRLSDAQRATQITRGISNNIVARMNDKKFWHFFDNKTEFNAFKRFRLSVAGFLDARVAAGAVWNKAPWPLLMIAEANQSFSYRRESFHMLNALEFISDRSVQFNLTWHMKGMLLNRIPLIKKLNLRELVIFNGVYGTLSDMNNPALNPGCLLAIPEGTGQLKSMPYLEVGVGLENVFKLLRIAYFQRLTYRDANLSWMSKWGGLRFGVYVDF